MRAARQRGLSDAMLDRLMLDADRVEAMAAGLETIVELPDPEGEMDSVPMHNVIPFMSETPGAIRRPAPKLGEHNAEIFGQLGLSSVDLERMAAEGVV